MNTIQGKNIHELMISIGKDARDAARILAITTAEIKNKAILAIAKAIRRNQAMIQNANEKDLVQAKQKGLHDHHKPIHSFLLSSKHHN